MLKRSKLSQLVTRHVAFSLVLLVVASQSSFVYAHADHDKARFVSSSGVDSGKCDDASKPCKTITYAGLQSNKGDTIRLAAGNYKIEDVDTLFYLLSDLVPVKGLYLSLIHISEPTRPY